MLSSSSLLLCSLPFSFIFFLICFLSPDFQHYFAFPFYSVPHPFSSPRVLPSPHFGKQKEAYDIAFLFAYLRFLSSAISHKRKAGPSSSQNVLLSFSLLLCPIARRRPRSSQFPARPTACSPALNFVLTRSIARSRPKGSNIHPCPPPPSAFTVQVPVLPLRNPCHK